jgi:hypothetical protein
MAAVVEYADEVEWPSETRKLEIVNEEKTSST